MADSRMTCFRAIGLIPRAALRFSSDTEAPRAGFILVTRGSPASDDPEVFDVAEFFVLRRYRRFGVGRRAAILIWDRFPGRWIVRVSEGNRGAVPFWRNVIAEYTNAGAIEHERPGSPNNWRVSTFQSQESRCSQ